MNIPVNHWQLNPAHSGAWLRLRKMLPRLKGFNLLIFQHNQPLYRDRMIAAMSADVSPSLVLDAKEYGSFVALEQALFQTTDTSKLIHIVNIESLSGEEKGLAFKGLNYHREQIAQRCLCTLAIWLPEPLVKQMALEAADFWAWREQVFDFGVPVEAVPRWEADFHNVYSVNKEKKQQRIDKLETYLKAQKSSISVASADMYHEIGNLYEEIGEPVNALKQLRHALTAFDYLDEKHAWARVLGDIASIKYKQGELQAALELLEQKVLPCFKELGDVKQQAETLGRMADILQARGQLDEALKIRQIEQLPVYEQLGDVRGMLVGRTKLAMLLWRIDSVEYLEKIESLLNVSLADARRLQIPEAGQIESIMQQIGLTVKLAD